MFAFSIIQTQGFFGKILQTSILSKNNDLFINCLCCLLIGFFLYIYFYKSKNQRLIAFLILVFILYNPHDGNLRKKAPVKVTSMPVKKIIISNGQTPPLEVYVPKPGDPPGDAPLPCTPYLNNNLCLIEPGNIKSGFYLKK